MGLSKVVLVVIIIALLASMVVFSLRAKRVVPTELAMSRSLRRMNNTTVVATLAGLVFASWAWFTFPTAYVNATSVPGLLAALGPALAGLVYLGVTAASEGTWRLPSGDQRAAFLARRPLFSRAFPWATRALWVWAGLLTVLLVTFGLIAEPDGRSLRNAPDVGSCLADGVPVPCGGGASGPFPGWPYGVPVLVAALLVVAATLAVLHLVARRPAVWGTSATDDELLRAISATRVVRGAQLSLGTSLAGITFFAGATASNAGWWWGWVAIILAVTVLGASFGVAMRRVNP